MSCIGPGFFVQSFWANGLDICQNEAAEHCWNSRPKPTSKPWMFGSFRGCDLFPPLNSVSLSLALMVEVMSVVFGHKLIMTNSVVATLSIRFHQRKDNLDVARRLGDSMTWRRCAVFVFTLRLLRKFNAVAEGKFQNCRILRLFLASYLKKRDTVWNQRCSLDFYTPSFGACKKYI